MTIADVNWSVLASLFPTGWQEMALQSGAFERLREFSSPGVLLRTLLLHVARGYSLRETVVRAKLAHWADVSDVALLKRLRKSENWLRSLCVELLQENGVNWGEEAASPRIRIVDGTVVKEPGTTGGLWRILYSLQLPNLRCDYFEVTATLGEGSGESLNRLSVHPQELILADAGYCSIAGIEHVQRRGADVLVRVNPQSFVAYAPSGRRISLLRRLRPLSKEGQYGEWRVVLHGQDPSFAGRLCAVRKSARSIQQAHRRLHRRASKKQMSTKQRTFEFAKYVLVFTTRFRGSTTEVLELYRRRWQIELLFKRLKSLAMIGHVPKHDARSSRAWLYGKSLVSLLTEKFIRTGRDISPGATQSRREGPPSKWREFSFALHQIQQAIEPHLPLRQTLFSWNHIAKALAENSRNRSLPWQNGESSRQAHRPNHRVSSIREPQTSGRNAFRSEKAAVHCLRRSSSPSVQANLRKRRSPLRGLTIYIERDVSRTF